MSQKKLNPQQLLDTAKGFATDVHSGQMYGDLPYHYHLANVASLIDEVVSDDSIDKIRDQYIEFANLSKLEILTTLKAAAWLHDCVEDQDVTGDQLLELGIWPSVVNATMAITKDKGFSRYWYLLKVTTNSIARVVKIADSTSNLICSLKSGKDGKRRVLKYTENLAVLSGSKSLNTIMG